MQIQSKVQIKILNEWRQLHSWEKDNQDDKRIPILKQSYILDARQKKLVRENCGDHLIGNSHGTKAMEEISSHCHQVQN